MPKTVEDKMNIIKQYVKEALSEQFNQKETITRSELKEVIKHTIRAILMEIQQGSAEFEDESNSSNDLNSTWNDDQQGEYIQINPDDSVYYIAHGTPKEKIAPKGTEDPFQHISAWSEKNQIFLNIWKVNDHGNVELLNNTGESLGGLTENKEFETGESGGVYPVVTLQMDAMGHVHMWPGDVNPIRSGKYMYTVNGQEAPVYFQVDTDIQQLLTYLTPDEIKDLENGYPVVTRRISDEYFGDDSINEITDTSAASPINLPGNVKGGWVSSKGGSQRGLDGSSALGYTLTPIGKEEMKRKQDPV